MSGDIILLRVARTFKKVRNLYSVVNWFYKINWNQIKFLIIVSFNWFFIIFIILSLLLILFYLDSLSFPARRWNVACTFIFETPSATKMLKICKKQNFCKNCFVYKRAFLFGLHKVFNFLNLHKFATMYGPTRLKPSRNKKFMQVRVNIQWLRPLN